MIDADPGHVSVIRKAIAGEDSAIDFEKIITIPNELKGTRSPMQIITQEEYDAQEAKNAEHERIYGFSRCLTLELSQKYKREFGYDNWYDWQLNAWGTKWNAYQTEALSENLIRFDTAWSHPEGVLRGLSKMFPCARFISAFADEDTGRNCGVTIFEDGKPQFVNAEDEGESLATAFAIIINGYDVETYANDLVSEECWTQEQADGIIKASESDHPLIKIAKTFTEGEIPKLEDIKLLETE
jgi:hypothetical protein